MYQTKWQVPRPSGELPWSALGAKYSPVSYMLADPIGRRGAGGGCNIMARGRAIEVGEFREHGALGGRQ